MGDINNKEYAAFLEETLRTMMELPVEGICIVTKMRNGHMFTNYFNANVADKIAYAGLIQQDAMIDTLKANNWISDKDSDRE